MFERKEKRGNVLGELTAEADSEMLKDAFYESRNYRELIGGDNFRFVVGRRGTGKSALFRKVSETFGADKHILLLTEHPFEEKMSAWQYECSKITDDYFGVRKIARLAWKTQVLTDAVTKILEHYKSSRLDKFDELEHYRNKYGTLFAHVGTGRSLQAFREVLAAKPGIHADAIPEAIAEQFQLSQLQKLITDALPKIGARIVFLYDGLDEGWVPTQTATGLIGGLAKLAAEFRESQSVHCLLFIRDNMFRALGQFDRDYTRNIEGNTLRLHWDEASLLSVVALRLRKTFEWGGEQDVKAWNRFAKRGLEGMDGFRKCLRLTLYRPRDLIALLNAAYQIASFANREAIIDDDVEVAATQISKYRLSDLYKEYEQVLPGLSDLGASFNSRAARMSYGEVRYILNEVLESEASGMVARDFALLATGADAFSVLYSVGFLGVAEPAGVTFCHDGSNTNVKELQEDQIVMVHPCYWRALELKDGAPDEVVVRVDDEEDAVLTKQATEQVADMRLRKLGTVIAELGTIEEGPRGAHDFERWVYTTVKYLFSKGLDNIQHKPNPDLVQQRDIVGTVKETSEFWKRVGKYNVSQFIIEAKNFIEMSRDEFRQCWGYLTGPYGRCMMVVTRADADAPVTEHERALIKEGYDTNGGKLVLLMPAKLLQRGLRKMNKRNETRDDYIENILSKRMDLFEREYLGQKTPRVRRKKSKKHRK